MTHTLVLYKYGKTPVTLSFVDYASADEMGDRLKENHHISYYTIHETGDYFDVKNLIGEVWK